MTQFLRITDAIAWLASVVSRLMLTAVAVAVVLVLQVILRFGFDFSLP